MLTAIQIMNVFIVLQGESNSTNIAPDPWDFPFSLAAAIGSLATFAGFIVLLWQSRLTRTQISQTQQEIDSTLRPWLGHKSCEITSVPLGGTYKTVARIGLKNYGRLPARLTRQVQLWKKTEIGEEDLANLQKEMATRGMIFPDQEEPYDFGADQSLIYAGSEFYFGFLLWYDFHVGEGVKGGKYGFIIKCKVMGGNMFEWTLVNTLAE
jgi:hypothetical protein